MTNFEDYRAPEEISRWRTFALGIGGLLSIIILVIAVIFPEQREQALRSWLLGFIFWGGIGIGCLGVLILQYLTGGAWGVVSRRILEAGSRTIPILFVLFLPIMAGVTYAYEWTHLMDLPVVVHRQPYLSVEWWIFRAVLYFILWYLMAYFLNKWSAQQDQAKDFDQAAKLLADSSKFSGPTMVFFVLVVSFAAIDWVMTLDPHWFSTMYGFLFTAGWGLSCFCFVVANLAFLANKAPLNRIIGKRHFHDLGKLMLALTMVWAYFNFSQFLIIWSGNLPEETTWYLSRLKGGWGVVGAILILFHFAFPFLVLLTRDVKMRAKWLASLAVFILVLRLVDMFYLISPNPRISTHGKSLELWASFSWMDIAAPLAVGGIWLWFYFGELMKRPLVPVNDPYLGNAIEHGKGH
ncbi:MAG: hypothetical protein JWN60_1179 [Acidobacteria bacterium]|jgi:hypothetical protein|nr:hypothetical protein [Acidobacteriota bacterium]